jgi:ubiquitin-like modifier-activating enzyme ATG7
MLTLSFYNEYQKKILNEYKFDNAIRPLTAFYETSDSSQFLRFEDFSFEDKKNPQITGHLFTVSGLLAHYSTIDNFNKLNNLDSVLKVIQDSPLKYNFIVFIYGDLKTFIFKYKFILLHKKNVNYKMTNLINNIPNDEIKKLIEENEEKNKNNVNQPSFYLLNDNKTILIKDYSSKTNTIPDLIKNSLFCTNNDKIETIILDKSEGKYLSLEIKEIKLINISETLPDLKNTITSELELFTTDLKQMFNPESIAENAVDLNINLMKWRMCPQLDTQIIKDKKYLLIGSGTLGCHVSRCLLGWGARHITMVDNGKVSYSNPVRQSLYTFKDSTNIDNNYKALLAAEKLKEIFPKADSKGFNLNIPLPGRTLIDETAKNDYFKNLELLENLIKEHDIMFLLTDSRESRWYPTIIGKAYNKLVITAAIGFDSFLVMRHGNDENKLGCYFCTDIVTPTDTSGSRTLDQQCTISRPGVSMICSGMALELAMSCLNSPLNKGLDEECVPHQIRGNLIDFDIHQFRFNYNKNCVACSDNMMKEYKENREKFIINVMNDPYYIEKTCGVHDLLKEIKIEDTNDGDDF